MNLFLGIDTSCYTTSVAAVDENQNIISCQRKILNVKQGEKGLRQSDALFQHINNFNELLEKLFEEINNKKADIFAVAASFTPRQNDGSYMPVFKAGVEFAKTISLVKNIRLIQCNHQLGHLYAAKYKSGLSSTKFLAIHLSGGTTEVLLVDNDNVSIVGKTNDISIGQLIDRIGVKLGLAFPAGPHLEKIALKFTSNIDNVPTSINYKKNTINFAGLENFYTNLINKQLYSPNDIAYSIFKTSARTIFKLIINIANELQIKDVLLFGGVASSNLFREILKDYCKGNSLNLYWGKNELCGDNAVGVALYCRKVFLNEL